MILGIMGDGTGHGDGLSRSSGLVKVMDARIYFRWNGWL